MTTNPRWCHLNGLWGRFRSVVGEGRHPAWDHTYQIKIVHAPCILCDMGGQHSKTQLQQDPILSQRTEMSIPQIVSLSDFCFKNTHTSSSKVSAGGSCLSHTAVKPDSHLARIFVTRFLCIIKLIIIIG